MEEIFILLIQFVVELFIQVILYLPFDWSFYSEGERDGCGLVFVYLVLGGLLGGLSLLIAPHLLLPDTVFRLLNLVLAPPATGWLGWSLANSLRKKGINMHPSIHFWYAFSFALAFSGVRLAYASR